MMDSFLSMFPKGLFGRTPLEPTTTLKTENVVVSSYMEVEDRCRKRPLDNGDCTNPVLFSRTPTLISTRRRLDVKCFPVDDDDHDSDRRVKRFCGATRVPSIPLFLADEEEANAKPCPSSSGTVEQKSVLQTLPEDVLTHCLSYLGSVEDRFALQCTSKQFRRISDSEEMLIGIEVGGDRSTGLHGIVLETDTPDTAHDKLTPFALAGNLEAIYMIGIIKSYCHQDVENGICCLKTASAQGYVRASYALGLVLRDSYPEEAGNYMKMAADGGYLPALQELLTAREMKEKYGEPSAEELRRHLDPLCLNRLLARHYVRSVDLRELNTSHCWNPLCGRWAFKATVNTGGVMFRMRRFWSHTLVRHEALPRDSRPLEDASIVTETGETVVRSGSRGTNPLDVRVSRMKMCSRCCRAKYCSKLCQVYDWRSGRHKMECQFL